MLVRSDSGSAISASCTSRSRSEPSASASGSFRPELSAEAVAGSPTSAARRDIR